MQFALTPDGRWDFATPDLVSAAATAGFTAVGIDADNVDAAAVDAYSAAKVRCHEVLALIVTDDEAATLASAERLADAAKTISAQWVLTVFTSPPSASVLQQCAKVFGDAGAGMAVEFSPLGPVSTIAGAMEVVRAASGGGRAALLIDSWHFLFGESTWEDLATVPLDDLAYVQFTDALEPEFRDRMVREALHRRALPGEGVLELGRFAATLLDRGYDSIVSVEVLNAQLRTELVDVLTRRLYDTTAAYWLS
ncbi:sugar phosphate isomerase/epimerase family protein [Mycobacterium sp. MMS18-G62]